jgi:hypothetical protein
MDKNIKLIEALVHTLMEGYGNDAIYHPDGVTQFSVNELTETYTRWKEPEGEALMIAEYEATLDSVASEFIGVLGDERVKGAWYLFSDMLQRAAEAKYPTTKFQFV